jgi:hypothetical protein
MSVVAGALGEIRTTRRHTAVPHGSTRRMVPVGVFQSPITRLVETAVTVPTAMKREMVSVGIRLYWMLPLSENGVA